MQSGAINALTVGKDQVLASPVVLSLYRPATENDLSWDGRNRQWVEEGLDSISQRMTDMKFKNNRVTAETEILGRKGSVIGQATFTYFVNGEGTLAVECDFRPDTAVIKNLPASVLYSLFPRRSLRRSLILAAAARPTLTACRPDV